MADNTGIYEISGKVEATLSSSLHSALAPPSGNINLRRLPERHARDLSEIREVRQSPTNFMNVFVIPELSSSRHEVSSTNGFVSGSAALERTAVAATGTQYYAKNSQLVKLVYKLSASAGLPSIPGNLRGPSQIENFPRNTFDPVSGSYRNNSYTDPAIFEINVPEYGTIRDIKVWVELIHDHRGGTGASVAGSSNPFWGGGSGSVSEDLKQGLQGLQIAIRSPNTNFMYAHPLWNDKSTYGFQKNPNASLSASLKIPELLRNSYLLWAGHSVEEDLGYAFGSRLTSSISHWSLETVATSSSGLNFKIGSTSMKADANGNPVFVWERFKLASALNSLQFRRSYYDDNGAVSSSYEEIVALGSARANNISLHLGSRDRTTPHVIVNKLGAGIYYYTSGTAGWSEESVGGALLTSVPDFALDSKDKIMVITQRTNSSPQLLVQPTVSGSGWISMALGNSVGTAIPASIVCDSNDVFQFCFFPGAPNASAQTIVYGKSGSDGLSISRVPYRRAYTSVSIVVDSSNQPVIFAAASGAAGIDVFHSTSAGWSSRTFLESKISGAYFSPRSARSNGSNGETGLIFALQSYRNSVKDHVCFMLSSSNGMSFAQIDNPLNRNYTGSMGDSLSLDFDDFGRVHAGYNSLVGALPNGASLSYSQKNLREANDSPYYEFDSDIDMRTVFTDSSRFANPRSLGKLYKSANLNSPGNSALQVERAFEQGTYSSPLSCSVDLLNLSYFDPVLYESSWLTGANFPWMLDDRIPAGNFRGRNYSVTASLGLGVPTGWLTGPGGVASANEWPTSGSQIGPQDIQAVYPILDDIYVRKMTTEAPLSGVATIASFAKTIEGFRPGLRGTQVNGTWKLMIGNTAQTISGSSTGSERGGFWFRQFRLEFLVDQRRPIQFGSFSSRARKYSRTNSPGPTNNIIGIISGSASWDTGLNYVLFLKNEEYGRSLGITSSTGSDGFAVFTRLTGTFADNLNRSGTYAEVMRSFLDNEFGTPYIPISSGSSEIPSFDVFDVEESRRSRRIFDEIINPKTLVPKDNTLKASLSRADVTISTRDAITKKNDEE